MRVCLECGRALTSGDWRCSSCGHAPEVCEGHLAFAAELSHGDGSDGEYCHEELFSAEAEHFWFRVRNRLLTWALDRYFPDARSLLEIGCGTGFVLHGFQAARPTLALAGSDILVKSLGYAQKRLPTALLFQMDARRIPFAEHFDVIGAFDVLEHVREDEAVLAEMFKATRPGGGILLTVPQHPFLWSALDDAGRHKRRYTRAELVRKVEGAGFVVARKTSFMAMLLPVLMASRLVRRGNPQQQQIVEELRVGRIQNRALESVFRVEIAMIRSGLSLPVGGSLLLVARRPTRGAAA